ncbi:MAG: glutaredoxin 3 [Magnetovibrio sp.]|nr:glutaredoxin 3 [Magnetovibrio sp.]|tara:strand:- start:270 stop:527 length:258 start_codon:yes stop_codon:yes gene_type:complete
MNRIEIYTSPLCVFCHRAKSLLNSKKIEYEEIDVRMQPSKRQEMVERCGFTSVPQVFSNGHHVGDCNRIYALDADGKLDSALGID